MAAHYRPHNFVPYRWYDQYKKEGRCKLCIIPKNGHPTESNALYRSSNNKKRYTWRELSDR